MNQLEFEKFAHPPIMEAICLLNFSEEITLDKLVEFSKKENIKSRFPVIKNLFEQKISINPHKETSPKILEGLQEGIVFQNSEKNFDYILQTRRNGMSFHKVKNYNSWEDLQSEFRFILKIFSTLFQNEIELKDIGVRYINHIPISPNQSLDDYFKLLPREVPGIPLNINKFFLQLGVEQNGLNGLIIESILNVESSLKFVIDLRVTKSMNGVFLNSEQLWSSFEEIRNFKNQLFFNIITDKIKPLFR